MTDTNTNEAVVVPMKDLLGKRGFILEGNKTTTVTLIAVDIDEADTSAVMLITSDGRKINASVSEVTFDEPDDEQPEPEAPAAPALVPAPSRGMTLADTTASGILDPNMYIQMKGLASDFFNSNAVPSAYQNMLQVLMALQAGKEMGMQPIESIQSITIINGTMSVWGKAVPGRLRAHGWSLKFDEGGEGRDQYCQATITKAEETYTDKMTFGEAEDSEYTKDKYGKLKPGWKPGMNRRLKLRYDALDVLCKTYVPEVFGGTAGTAEVLQDVDFDSDKPTLSDKIKVATGKLDTKAKVIDA